MGHNPPGFQERWEFRKHETNDDSSSDDDSKSNSEEILKSQRLIVEDDYKSDDTAQIKPKSVIPAAKGESKCKKPRNKPQTRVTKRKKLVDEKTEHMPVKKSRRKKSYSLAFDPSLMEDLKSFSESLLKDVKATGEKLFVKMREEIFDLISHGPSKDNNEHIKVGLEQNKRNVRYDQMPSEEMNILTQRQWGLNKNNIAMNDVNQLPIRENTISVSDFPQIQYQRGFWLSKGIPNTSLNRPFFMSGESEGTILNMPCHQNSEYLSGNVNNLQSSSRVDGNVQENIRRQKSTNNINFGLLPTNEARDQSRIWREPYRPNITDIEYRKISKPDVPIMKDDTRQLTAVIDEREAFRGNFCAPTMLRETECEQRGRLLGDPKFSSNFLSPAASSMYFALLEGKPNTYMKSQSTGPSSCYIQHKTSGNQTIMNGGFARMMAEGGIESGYLGLEQNHIRCIPQVGNSDLEQCNLPKEKICNN